MRGGQVQIEDRNKIEPESTGGIDMKGNLGNLGKVGKGENRWISLGALEPWSPGERARLCKPPLWMALRGGGEKTKRNLETTDNRKKKKFIKSPPKKKGGLRMRREKREFGWGGRGKEILKGAVIVCRLFGVFWGGRGE